MKITSSVLLKPDTNITIHFEPASYLSEEVVKKAKKVYGVCFLDNKLVLIYNSKRNIWGFPGGGIEDGETISEALQREMHEEAEVDVVDSHLLGYSYLDSDPDVYQIFYMVTGKKRAEFTADPDEGVTEHAYINPEEYTKYLQWAEIGEYLINVSIDVLNKK